MTARRIFTGTSHFPTLRENRTVYVDKTALIHRMTHADVAFFLARPRRFGKSLLVTTLEAYFQGRRELFTGLAMETLEQEWTHYPVLRFDMSGTAYITADDLKERLNVQLSQYEEAYGIRPDSGKKPSLRLMSLIPRVRDEKRGQVVILIDEYDAPLLDPSLHPDAFEETRDLLFDFFAPLKPAMEHLRFLFVTGLTKYVPPYFLSGILNNLNHISMTDDYTAICGITEEEIRMQLRPEVEALAEKNDMTFDDVVNTLRERHGGFHFTRESPEVCNAQTLLDCLQSGDLDQYRHFLAPLPHLTAQMRRSSLRPEELEDIFAIADMFYAPVEGDDSLIPLLYQHGYLTIKNREGWNVYILGFPNEEMRQSFLRALLPLYSGSAGDRDAFFLLDFTLALEEGDIDRAMRLLRDYFAVLPYDADERNEAYYKTMFYLIFRMSADFELRTEERFVDGRCDARVETGDAVYVFAFKLKGTAQEALAQIEKGSMIPDQAGGKRLYKIGASLDTELRTLKEWVVVEAA